MKSYFSTRELMKLALRSIRRNTTSSGTRTRKTYAPILSVPTNQHSMFDQILCTELIQNAMVISLEKANGRQSLILKTIGSLQPSSKSKWESTTNRTWLRELRVKKTIYLTSGSKGQIIMPCFVWGLKIKNLQRMMLKTKKKMTTIRNRKFKKWMILFITSMIG